MYLKSLRLVGFKSFAESTTLDLQPGLTVVVGPNGSGKSNLVDAVAWAMGTQAPSTLRSQRMEDLVFAGTATRPPFGRAEVTLTFDNQARRLPLDLPEVTLSRRLYRDGTSGYEINRTSCRLIDIEELLSEGGVGRHQHVIVGQGQLDAVLSAGAEDHRAIIEEAAGVRKHRARKERAVRTLERTDGDVARLRDISTELRRQMRPLRRQAEAAERHETVRSEARALRLFLSGEQLRRIGGRLDELERHRERLVGEEEQASQEVAAGESALPGHEERAAQIAASLERDGSAEWRLETIAERLRGIAQVAHERRRAAELRLEGTAGRRREEEEEIAQLQAGLTAAAEEERQLNRRAAQAEVALRAAEDEERSLADQEALPPEGAEAVLRGELRALEAAAVRDADEQESMVRREEVLQALVADEAGQAARLGEEIRALDALAAQAHDRYLGARKDREEQQERWDGSVGASEEARLALAEVTGRLEALQEASERPETRIATRPPGVRGELESVLDVPPELRRACRAAVGDWWEGWVMDGVSSLPEVVRSFRSSAQGVLALAVMDESPGPAPGRGGAAEGDWPALVDLLGAKADRALAARLVGDVVVVDDWEAGWELVRRHQQLRAVTREGDLATPLGVRLAAPKSSSVLEEVRAAREAARTELARAETRITTTHRDFEVARRLERCALECLEELESRLAGATEALHLLERSRSAVEAELERLQDRGGALRAEGDDRERRLSEIRQRLQAMEGEDAEQRRAWEELSARRGEAALRRQLATKAREEAAAAQAACAERRRLQEARLAELRAILGGPDRLEAGVPSHLAQVEHRAQLALEAIRTHLEDLRRRGAGLRKDAGLAAARLSRARLRLEASRGLAAEAREQLSKLAVEAAELSVREEAETEALRRDLDADPEEALVAPRPEGDGFEDRLASLEAELRRMGPVNPLAAAEYRELTERAGFLEAQLEDLELSRHKIRSVIKVLDDRVVELFSEVFAEVAAHFEEGFRVLFPGGRGRLRLTDPQDMLESGVEIEAQPLGKRAGRLTLLSGGERSLAALAFLFAVFMARPSPFYILDEVDAALDDPNLRRFLRLVDQMRATAQLVVVTHQQQTMQAADLLYGVTMEPSGSSKVVSKRMAEVPATA